MDEPQLSVATAATATAAATAAAAAPSKLTWKERARRAVEDIEARGDARLAGNNLIGRVVQPKRDSRAHHVRLKSVTFSWQRGVKIGTSPSVRSWTPWTGGHRRLENNQLLADFLK